MPLKKMTIACQFCDWTGEVRCNTSVCPQCKKPFISPNPENDRQRLILENRGLRQQIKMLSEENQSLKAKLRRIDAPPSIDVATVFVNPQPLN